MRNDVPHNGSHDCDRWYIRQLVGGEESFCEDQRWHIDTWEVEEPHNRAISQTVRMYHARQQEGQRVTEFMAYLNDLRKETPVERQPPDFVMCGLLLAGIHPALRKEYSRWPEQVWETKKMVATLTRLEGTLPRTTSVPTARNSQRTSTLTHRGTKRPNDGLPTSGDHGPSKRNASQTRRTIPSHIPRFRGPPYTFPPHLFSIHLGSSLALAASLPDIRNHCGWKSD